MTREEMINKIEYLTEIESMVEELKNEAEGIKDEIKIEMNNSNLEEINLGKYIIRWTSVLTTRFDTKKFKETLGDDFYKLYTKEVSSRRFSIAYLTVHKNNCYREHGKHIKNPLKTA